MHEALVALRIDLQRGVQLDPWGGPESDPTAGGGALVGPKPGPQAGAGRGWMHQSGACCTAVGLIFALEPLVFREKTPGTIPAE